MPENNPVAPQEPELLRLRLHIDFPIYKSYLKLAQRPVLIATLIFALILLALAFLLDYSIVLFALAGFLIVLVVLIKAMPYSNYEHISKTMLANKEIAFRESSMSITGTNDCQSVTASRLYAIVERAAETNDAFYIVYPAPSVDEIIPKAQLEPGQIDWLRGFLNHKFPGRFKRYGKN